MRVGVLSDTHGLLRPRVLELLGGCDRILHAGDVGGAEILSRLREIAPVEAVRGNTDSGPEARELPLSLSGEIEGLPFRMIHRREDVDSTWAKQVRLIVFGHSHRPELEWRGACLLLNPGACGARRFSLPLTLAILTVLGGRLVPEILAVE
ncbi:MAG TPA: metallophosphoesterase family protein [Thermoanaerobaculia bacterium]|nr:metallophosphoesterase family protein [Thermoanaerobaculia bacterium]